MTEVAQPPPVDTVPQEIVEQVADRVFTLERTSLIDLYCSVGQTVLDAFYQSDFAVWDGRNIGETALSRLAEAMTRRHAKWTEWKLYRAVRTYQQQIALGDFGRWPSLTASHLHAVQGLPWEKQRELLDAAQATGQQVRDLQRAANLARGIVPRTEKETAATEAQQVLRRFEKLLGEREELVADLGAVGVAEDSISGFEDFLEQLRMAVEAMRAEVREAAKPEPA